MNGIGFVDLIVEDDIGFGTKADTGVVVIMTMTSTSRPKNDTILEEERTMLLGLCMVVCV